MNEGVTARLSAPGYVPTVVGPHEPATQSAPPQSLPHTPQLRPSLSSRASQPLVGSPSQSSKPVEHPHVPSRQVPLVQATPHAPQLGAMERSASQPLSSSPSQSSKPAMHTHSP